MEDGERFTGTLHGSRILDAQIREPKHEAAI
jgi:hypothetical protein